MSDPQQLEAMAAEYVSHAKGLGLGAPFFATCFDSLLLGVILCQLIHWVPLAKHDLRSVRIIVGVSATAAILGTAYTWATYATAFVYEFGSYTRFVSLDLLGWYGTLDMLIVVPVQIFFSERSVRINGNSRILMVINAILVAATASMGIATTVSTRNLNVFTRTQQALNLCTAWPIVCTFTHIWLTSTILFGLWKSRSISERANGLITRLIVVSIESQLPSTMVAFIMMTIILADSKSPMVAFIAVVHPKVFLVGLLAMVNLRHIWRLKGTVPTSYETKPIQSVHLSSRPTMLSLGSTITDLGVQTPKPEHQDRDQLNRRQSMMSVLESGQNMPMREFQKDNDPFN